MEPVLNREQMRHYDALAIAEGRIPGVILMENAGRGAFEYLRRLILETAAVCEVLIVCGPGNNGGDGYVVARHLLADTALRIQVSVLVIADRSQIRGDAQIHLESLLALASENVHFCTPTDRLIATALAKADVIVDALFGTGLSRPITGDWVQLIDRINQSSALRVALDIPSGLDCDTGQSLGACIEAHHTITFAHAKPGLFTPAGRDKTGELCKAGLGFPDQSILLQTGSTALLLDDEQIRPLLQQRKASTYKHRSGDILVLAGSPGKTGAARLAAHAALRAGAGLTTICTWQEALPAFAREVTEIMLAPLSAVGIEDDLARAIARRNAVLVGPGLGTNAAAQHALEYVLEHVQVPLILDADAFTLLARNPWLAERIPPGTVMTPHSGELARLLQLSTQQIEADRYAAVKEAATRFRCTVVLKGAHTLIADARQIYVSPWANPVLATAGSGDVLAGLMTALSVQLKPVDAAIAAVYLHGLAGQIWSEAKGADRGMLAGDIADNLPGAFARILKAT